LIIKSHIFRLDVPTILFKGPVDRPIDVVDVEGAAAGRDRFDAVIAIAL
jgi:hypothetical protein